MPLNENSLQLEVKRLINPSGTVLALVGHRHDGDRIWDHRTRVGHCHDCNSSRDPALCSSRLPTIVRIGTRVVNRGYRLGNAWVNHRQRRPTLAWERL